MASNERLPVGTCRTREDGVEIWWTGTKWAEWFPPSKKEPKKEAE